jgi:hypothetical protein
VIEIGGAAKASLILLCGGFESACAHARHQQPKTCREM